MRYFYSERAGNPLQGSGVTVVFEKTCIIGSNICGIYATEDPNELHLLDAAMSQRAGVLETSKEDYDLQVAQKKSTQFSLPSLTLRPVQQLEPRTQYQVNQEHQGVPSAEKTESVPTSSKPVADQKIEDPRSMIKLDSVASPGLVREDERVMDVQEPKKSVRNRAVSSVK
jgi:hypothetical protein